MEPHDWDEHDTPAVIGFTSGTTGRPKGVMHSWAAMDWVGDLLTERSRAQYGESICVTGAGAGVPGFTFYTYWGLSRGLPIVKSERWDPQRVLELMARERCVWSVMVPTMLHMLMDARRTTGQDLDISAMRSISIGGSPMTADFIADARRLMGFEPLRVYAMAEIMMHNHMRLDDPVDDRDVKDGRPGPGCEIGIFDEHQRHLPVGETGEVGMRGPSLMLGYLGDPEGKSSKLTPDGYFLSGDLGRIDDEGYIRIVGRMKDMIIRGGYNIDPSEVEALIRLMPGVRDVAVVGYPDPVFGERACACIWRPDGTETGLAEVAEHLLGVGLTKEKLPERVICFEQIPQSPDGKILKGELRKQLAAEPALPGGS
jgi:acyl-CoA synthetase